MTTNYDWLDDGALLILMPRSAMPTWGGNETPDYDRACAAPSNWLVPFDVGDKRAFLLSGDPGMALVVPLPESGLGLVRWYYADDEEDLVEFALRREHVKRTEADQIFENVERDWVLFNAVWNPLTDAPSMREAAMPTGRVVADTAFFEAGVNAAIVHRFRPIDAPQQ